MKTLQIEPEEPVDNAWFMVEVSMTITYKDGREIIISPYYIPHGKLGPVTINPGSGPLFPPEFGILPTPAITMITLIVGVIIIALVIIKFLKHRLKTSLPLGKKPLRNVVIENKILHQAK